jgi:hypothetical protein
VWVHVQSLSHIGLHIDEHLSLGLLLFSLDSCLFLVYSPASLVKLFIGLRGLSFKIVLILIVIFNLDAFVVACLPYVMKLQLARHDLRDHITQLIRIVQEIATVAGHGLGLAHFCLVIVADDYWDYQRWLLGGRWLRLLHYYLGLLNYLRLLVYWLLVAKL